MRPLNNFQMATNILNGMTADGTARLEQRIPFTKDPRAREKACTFASRVIIMVDNCMMVEGDALYTVLASKLFAYLSKCGAQTAEVIHAVELKTADDIIAAVLEDPARVFSRAGIHAILRAHRQRSAQKAAELRRTLSVGVPPRRVIWESKHGRHRVEEATDPRHLMQDSAALHHCVGTCHNSILLSEHGLHRDDPEAIHHLQYWRKIKAGTSRIFTLTENGAPLLTIEYGVDEFTIKQMQGHPRREIPLTVLCPALDGLRQNVRLERINDLPREVERILTPNGSFTLPNSANAPLALNGTFAFPPDATIADVRAVLANPLITVNITALPQRILDQITTSEACINHAGTGDISIPNLARGILFCALANTVHLPRLRHGCLFASAATDVSLPLVETGTLLVGKLPKASFPNHRRGDISAPKALFIDLRQHTHGAINALAAETLILPADFDNATSRITCWRDVRTVVTAPDAHP